MEQKYEYDFIRLGEGKLWVKGKAKEEYQNVIKERARNGWRLVQVFSPSIGAYGASKYIEIILEREKGNKSKNREL